MQITSSRIEPPFENVAVDHRRAGDFSLRALLRWPDVDQQRAFGQLGCGLLRLNSAQASPGPIQQLVSGE